MSNLQSLRRAHIPLLTLIPAAVALADGTATPAAGPEKPSAAYASEVPPDEVDNSQEEAIGTGQQSLPIAQSVSEIVDQHVQGRGGYEHLKGIAGVDYTGTRYVDCEHYPLQARTARSNQSRTWIKIGDGSTVESVRSDDDIQVHGAPQGLRIEQERALLQTFDFEGPLIDWGRKRYDVRRLGMEKLPGVLAWKLEVDRPDGYRQILWLNSHHGDIVKEIIFDPQGPPVLEIERHDFRSVEGSRFAFAIEYKAPDGTLLASDHIQRIEVTRAPS
jgi:hypothetical protein